MRWQETLHVKKIDLSLDRVLKVAQRLRLPSIAKNVITVAGTNGKGSCVAFLEQLYLAARYRVGSYTSPHLTRYNERISVLGEHIADDPLIEAFVAIDHARQDTTLTYFEFGTLAAFYCFAQHNLDIALLEVGMGGRLDATNIIDADIAIITSIGLDHQHWLGSTRNAIAREKAGIFRPYRAAVCGDRDPPDALLDAAQTRGITLNRIGSDFDYSVGSGSWNWQNSVSSIDNLPLPANCNTAQLNNISTALQAASLLDKSLSFEHAAVSLAVERYSLPGRCQLIQEYPEIWYDVAHNPQSISALVQFLSEKPRKDTHIVLGFLADKNVDEMIGLLETSATSWHLAAPHSDRSLNVEDLMQIVVARSLKKAIRYNSVSEALESVLSQSGESDRIIVTGSFFTVSEAMAVKYGKCL